MRSLSFWAKITTEGGPLRKQHALSRGTLSSFPFYDRVIVRPEDTNTPKSESRRLLTNDARVEVERRANAPAVQTVLSAMLIEAAMDKLPRSSSELPDDPMKILDGFHIVLK